MAFSEEEKRKEATRLIESSDLRQKTESHRIITFLEKARQKDSTKRWSEKALGSGIHETGGTQIKNGSVRANIRRTRTFLDEHYRLQDTAYGHICLVLGRDRSRGKQGYFLDYESYPGPYNGLPQGPIDRFWKKQIVARALNRSDRELPAVSITIVFSDESSPISGKSRLSSDPPFWQGVWSGSGEVIGCYLLGKTFERAHLKAEITRSTLFGLGGTPHNSLVVYVGSSLGIRSLGEERERSSLIAKQRFTFRFGKDASGRKRGEILDKVPDPGEKSAYSCETINDWTFYDYALITYFYDKRLNQSIVGLAGISTLGTEQAVRMVTDPGKLSELLERVKLETGTDKQLPEFEMLLRVEVSHGSPVDGNIVAFSTPEKLAIRLKTSVQAAL